MKPRKFVAFCRKELQKSLEEGDERQISLALAKLGFALFRAGMIKRGLARFDDSLERARTLQEPGLLAQCLAIQTSAYQIIERLADAYQTAEEIRLLGQQHEDPRMVFDALASQGQILLDSGEPVIALEKLQGAQEIADQLEDKRRQMVLSRAFGNYSLAVASPERAESYFQNALAIAQELKDEQAEMGFIGGMDQILEWQEKNAAAVPALEEVLAIARKKADEQAEILVLRHLAQAHARLENDEKVLAYAQAGFELARERDQEAAIAFLEALARVGYRRNDAAKARQATIEAITLARTINDRNKELELLVSLGESYVISSEMENALVTYQKALKRAKALARTKDEAYLTGRVGFTLAEMGRLKEAIPYHQRAVELARRWSLPDLEGEQLSMLALSHLEDGDVDQATIHGQAAVEVYAAADLKVEADNARRLLAQIDEAKSAGTDSP